MEMLSSDEEEEYAAEIFEYESFDEDESVEDELMEGKEKSGEIYYEEYSDEVYEDDCDHEEEKVTRVDDNDDDDVDERDVLIVEKSQKSQEMSVIMLSSLQNFVGEKIKKLKGNNITGEIKEGSFAWKEMIQRVNDSSPTTSTSTVETQMKWNTCRLGSGIMDRVLIAKVFAECTLERKQIHPRTTVKKSLSTFASHHSCRLQEKWGNQEFHRLQKDSAYALRNSPLLFTAELMTKISASGSWQPLPHSCQDKKTEWNVSEIVHNSQQLLSDYARIMKRPLHNEETSRRATTNELQTILMESRALLQSISATE